MKVLVTGSSGHLGEALARGLRELAHDVVGLDVVEGAFTTCVGSITDRACVARAMKGARVVFHVATPSDVAGARFARATLSRMRDRGRAPGQQGRAAAIMPTA